MVKTLATQTHKQTTKKEKNTSMKSTISFQNKISLIVIETLAYTKIKNQKQQQKQTTLNKIKK